MSRYRLVDEKTGIVIRHSLRTLREAERERGWYEENTGRKIRIVKVFLAREKPPLIPRASSAMRQ